MLGKKSLLAYQIGGNSAHAELPDWRTFETRKIESLKLLSKNFRADDYISGLLSHYKLAFKVIYEKVKF